MDVTPSMGRTTYIGASLCLQFVLFIFAFDRLIYLVFNLFYDGMFILESDDDNTMNDFA